MSARLPGECETAALRTEVKDQITMLGNAAVAEVAPRRESHRRWFRLSPVDDVILLLEVEFPIGVDPTEWPKVDADYVVVSTETFASLDLGLDTLRKRGVDTNTFDAVWKSENPF
jgi:hypothetical protein